MIGLGAVGLGLLPLGQLWLVTWPSLAIAAVTTLGLGVGIALHEQTRARHAEATLGRVRAEQFATEALLASLEARLRPHFLYNALNTIAGVIPKDTRLAHRLLCDLGAVLRLTLDRRGRRTVPLEDELEVVLAYLEIQEARFRRLDYATDVPPALRRCEIPPFALQPVVENSVVHVAQARPGRMRLRVEARAAGDTLKLQVWDDGPGFSLDAVRPGHGLDTLRQRLDALYGGAAGLAVDRCEEGTMVTIRLPLRPERRP
jgi:LytS/YehU family sensor histidine kinase